PQVGPELIRARAARLRAAAARVRDNWLQSLVGSTQQVLVERPGDRGHAGNFAEVRLAPSQVGEIVSVKIVDVRDGKLIA
ncbi:tRNA (N(6)-L-threonylcarbamoyladenosine(37)-C(2))-methylthiotransferase MtaB, partial [Escherichia coli]|nr:tRNA (N(6)-L-threonylcarbamoyladenosine(37)-C(2))-methylthiotransferase MtaB [Escherichia coli]